MIDLENPWIKILVLALVHLLNLNVYLVVVHFSRAAIRFFFCAAIYRVVPEEVLQTGLNSLSLS